MNQILDLLELKQKHNLLEEDATFEKMVDWYEYALSQGLVETIYKNGKLKGFLEWVRLEDVPKDIDNIPLNHNTIKTAPVLFVSNAIAENIKMLLDLRRMLFAKNKNYSVLCWHSKKRDKMIKIRRLDDALPL